MPLGPAPPPLYIARVYNGDARLMAFFAADLTCFLLPQLKKIMCWALFLFCFHSYVCRSCFRGRRNGFNVSSTCYFTSCFRTAPQSRLKSIKTTLPNVTSPLSSVSLTGGTITRFFFFCLFAFEPYYLVLKNNISEHRDVTQTLHESDGT